MTRTRLQGHNEAEAWRAVTDTWPAADLSMTRSCVPVEHWTVVVKEPAFGGHPVTAHGYTRYEALHHIIVMMEQERRVQDEMAARSSMTPEHDINCGIDPLRLGEDIGCTCYVRDEWENSEIVRK